jgi:hypothetical protein
MRISFSLIALAVLGGMSNASALTSQPAQRPLPRLQAVVGLELVARRLGAPYRYRAYRGAPHQYRQYVTPQTRAAPMARVPQVAPLSPRVGN